MKMIGFQPRTALLALASSSVVYSHTVFSNFFVDGIDQGRGTCVRSSNVERQINYPVIDVNSNSMACNVGGQKGVARTCPVNDGARLTFEFNISPWDEVSQGIQDGHLGPCSVYMKKVDSAIDDQAIGDGWFKLWHEGFDDDAGRWCSSKFIKNGGYLSIDLPKGLKGGDYLVRPELLALHVASKGEPQFYHGCAQIFLQSSGTLVPDETVSIPGFIKKDDPSVNYNYFREDSGDYELPGPPVLESFSPSGSQGPSEQTEGVKPEGCILEIANMCVEEFPKPSDIEECWDITQSCWDEAEICWGTVLSAFAQNCKILNDQKCKKMADRCRSRDFSAPDQGVVLTPEPKNVNLPAPYPGSGSATSTPCCEGGMDGISYRKFKRHAKLASLSGNHFG